MGESDAMGLALGRDPWRLCDLQGGHVRDDFVARDADALDADHPRPALRGEMIRK